MALLLKSEDGAEFELALIRDRFPGSANDPADAAYATLSMRVATPDDSWETTAPCMNLFELGTLGQWLEAVARGEPDLGEVEVLEPALKFSILEPRGDGVSLRITFRLADRPERFAVDPETTEAHHLDLRLTPRDLLGAAGELRRDLASLDGPTRADGEPDPGVAGLPDEALAVIDERSPVPGEADDEQAL
jgi:hypothetical protein